MGQLKQLARRLRRTPGFTAITLLTLAIGIGANTAIFSILSGVLLKPLPYPEPDRLIGVWQRAPGLNIAELNASPVTYVTYREENRTLEDIAMWTDGGSNVTGVAEPERVSAMTATAGLLPILRVQPAFGRRFTEKDDAPGAALTVMLSHGYWQRRFGGDRNIVGRVLQVDGRPREIIGVLPADFRFMNIDAKLVLPFQLDRNGLTIGNFSFMSLARLKPGVTIEQASADVARMLALVPAKFPPVKGMSLKMWEETRIAPNLRPLRNDVVGDIGKVLWILMGTITLVLFIACANVANLLLVRAEGRQQELAIRAALGAGRRRIAADLMTESLTLALLGGALGVAVAYGLLRMLVVLAPRNLPRIDEIAIDPEVLVFALLVSIGSGLLFGLVPMIKYAGPRIGATLREGGRTSSAGRERHRARGILVVVQVALALVLLIGSGLLLRSMQALRDVQPGFTKPSEVLTLRISIPGAQVSNDEQALRMEEEILRKIHALPGVKDASLSSSITMDGNRSFDPVYAEGHTYRDGQLPAMRRHKYISPDYVKTMGNRMVAGRDLTWTDVEQARPVALLSENLAREFFGSAGATVGKRVRETTESAWREVVGVIGDDRDEGADRPAPMTIYWPLMVRNMYQPGLRLQRGPAIAIRSERTGSPGFLDEVRQAVWSVSPDIPVSGVRTLREIHDRSMARTSFTLVMLSIAAGMALLLGVVGIYGVLSYSVSQRTREIGIRMALGAQGESVTRMFVRYGLMLAGSGIVCGLAAAAGLTRLLKALLFGVSPLDPVTYFAVPAVLLAAVLLASYIPARRATAVDPIRALRME